MGKVGFSYTSSTIMSQQLRNTTSNKFSICQVGQIKLKQGNVYIVCNLEIVRGDPEWKPNPTELFVLRVVPNRRAEQSANEHIFNIVEQEFKDD